MEYQSWVETSHLVFFDCWETDVHVDAQQHGTVRGGDVHYQNLIKMIPGNTKNHNKKYTDKININININNKQQQQKNQQQQRRRET